MLDRHRRDGPPSLSCGLSSVRPSVRGSEWTTTCTITLTITQYCFELREHRHVCGHIQLSSPRNASLCALIGGLRRGLCPRRNRRLGATAGSEYLGFLSGRVEGHPAVEEPLEAAHDGPSVEMLDEFIPACAAGRLQCTHAVRASTRVGATSRGVRRRSHRRPVMTGTRHADAPNRASCRDY